MITGRARCLNQHLVSGGQAQLGTRIQDLHPLINQVTLFLVNPGMAGGASIPPHTSFLLSPAMYGLVNKAKGQRAAVPSSFGREAPLRGGNVVWVTRMRVKTASFWTWR
jgi:hypothetical protein